MTALHDILFNMLTLYSFLLGVYGAVLAARNQPLSGNFWGTVAVYSGLATITLVIGFIMSSQGLGIERPNIYFLYMAFLIVIGPGLFSMLRGRDDRHAAIAFAILALFNASVAFSMSQRGLVGPWLPVS